MTVTPDLNIEIIVVENDRENHSEKIVRSFQRKADSESVTFWNLNQVWFLRGTDPLWRLAIAISAALQMMTRWFHLIGCQNS